MDTMEQARLDAVARLAKTNNYYAGGAKNAQKIAILSRNDHDDHNDDDDDIEQRIRKEIKKEYDDKFEKMRNNYNQLLQTRMQKERKIKQELNELQDIIKELEESKLKLLISTAAEIDKLRNVLKCV